MQISEQQAQEITVHERGAERALDEVEAIIAEIQERITPQALAGKAGNAVKEATVGRVGRAVDDMTDKVSETGGSFVERIRQNPIPAVLAGTGIAWLFMGGRRRGRSATRLAGWPSGFRPTPERKRAKKNWFSAYVWGRADGIGRKSGSTHCRFASSRPMRSDDQCRNGRLLSIK